MKQTFTILSVIIGLALNAQNWSPILTGKKMNYKHSDSAYITNTIWVDSAKIVNNDSLFFLNRIVKDVPNNQEIALRNQPQFLLKSIVKQAYGIYTCAGPCNYSILTLADLGQTWDFTDNINAEITSISEEDIFGQTDSVKTISLSDGNEIRLSTNFGILKFPDFENGGYFELVGIQDTDYGEQVIDFWDIFDFEVGDVFQYKIFIVNEGGGGILKHITKKYSIISKNNSTSSISYEIGGIWSEWGYSSGGSNQYVDSYTFSESLQFIDSANHIANRFNYELIRLWECNIYNGFSDMYSKVNIGIDSLGIIFLEYGYHKNSEESSPLNLYYLKSAFSDTLLRMSGYTPEPPTGIIGREYKKSIGLIASEWTHWEGEKSFFLEGYIKNGDTTGIITADSILLSTAKERDIQYNTFSIYPNPAADWLYIKPKDLGNGLSYSIKIRDVFGQLVGEEMEIWSSLYAMDISVLQSGVYFYEIKESSGNIQKGKFIVK